MRPTGHVRERSPGSWEVRYSIGVEAATGKRRMRTSPSGGSAKTPRKSCGDYCTRSTRTNTLTRRA